ncbi:MAG: glycosyltransferase family 4 protein [Clostridiales bacterium]|jgi:glycosyltransferase involved in cell wall biosynthesis|nr:glycosyltransferase family 4 protein [Clostridiales bacterium]
MRVLFQIWPGSRDAPAGDSIQMQMTKTYLEKLGVEVKVSSKQNLDLRDFDIIHIFNTARVSEAYGFYRNAVYQKKRIVVTPVFLDMHFYYRNKPARLAAWRAENLLRREIFQGSHMLLPNSNMELEWIRNTLMVDTRARIIYHGVEPIFFDADEKWFINKYGLSGFILCAGRLSPIKNQLSLIRAAGDLKIPIVLIGPVNNRDYAVKCAREAQGRVKYIPPMNQKELASAYHAAGVHVQPSWFETAGLSSLEAAAAGTPVAITAWGAAREYLKDKAAYVEPDSLDSIRAGIIAALKQNTASGKLEEIKEYIKDRFTWDKAARDTLDAYKEVLAEDYEPESGGVFYTQTFPVSPKFYSD